MNALVRLLLTGTSFLVLSGVSLAEHHQSAEHSSSLHDEILTLDTHIDVPIELGLEDADPGVDGPMQVDLPKMREGGLDSGFFIVYVGQGAMTDEGYADAYSKAQDKFTAIERMLDMYPDQIQLATTPDQLESIVSQGKLAAAIGVENAYPLGPDLAHLQEFYDRGARYASLTHFGHNHFADSSVGRGEHDGIPEPVNSGISDLGYQLIDELNRLGIMVDISHTSPETTIQAAEYSKAPIIASHSGVRALYDHPRNMNDEEIRVVAEKGGVIQLVAFDSYMRSVSEEELQALAAIRADMGLTGDNWRSRMTQELEGELRQRAARLHAKFPRATVAMLVDHIDYIVNLVGVDHAGISSDFGGGGGIHGWDHAGQTPAITEELLSRGYSEEDIAKIWSGNLLRVWRVAEQAAQ
jgi:membrane dipeptidase